MKRVTWKEVACPNCGALEVFPLDNKEYVCSACGCDSSKPTEKKIIAPHEGDKITPIIAMSNILAIFIGSPMAVFCSLTIFSASILSFNKKSSILKNIISTTLFSGGYIGLIVNIAIVTVKLKNHQVFLLVDSINKNKQVYLLFNPNYLAVSFYNNIIMLSIPIIAILSGASLGIGYSLDKFILIEGKRSNLLKKLVSIFFIISGLVSLAIILTIVLFDCEYLGKIVRIIAIIYTIVMFGILHIIVSKSDEKP